jgi:hypothetical protein
MVGNGLAHIPVLLGCAGGVELLQLEALLHDRLKQIERSDGVRHHRLVGAVPGLTDVGLRS